MDWELIRQWKQTLINRDNTWDNKLRVDYAYRVVDTVRLTKHTAYEYAIPYKVPFAITNIFTNGTVNLQFGAINMKYSIRRINPYKLDTKVDD